MDTIEKTQSSYALCAALGCAIGLTMPWMLPPLAYGVITKRWAWWHRWLKWTMDR